MGMEQYNGPELPRELEAINSLKNKDLTIEMDDPTENNGWRIAGEPHISGGVWTIRLVSERLQNTSQKANPLTGQEVTHDHNLAFETEQRIEDVIRWNSTK